MKYVDEGKVKLDPVHYAAAVVIVAVAGLFAIRYLFNEGGK